MNDRNSGQLMGQHIVSIIWNMKTQNKKQLSLLKGGNRNGDKIGKLKQNIQRPLLGRVGNVYHTQFFFHTLFLMRYFISVKFIRNIFGYRTIYATNRTRFLSACGYNTVQQSSILFNKYLQLCFSRLMEKLNSPALFQVCGEQGNCFGQCHINKNVLLTCPKLKNQSGFCPLCGDTGNLSYYLESVY